MRARYSNDKAKGPGHGLILITDTPDIDGMEGVSFLIKRASDQKSLGMGGWQPAESYISPDSVSLADDDGFALAVGPLVVDKLDPQESYRLSLRFSDGKAISGGLVVREVSYSLLDGGQGIAAAAITAPKPEPQPTPEPEPTPEPDPIPEPEPAPMPEALPEPEAAPKRSMLPLALVLILLLGLGGFALWYFVLAKDDPITAGTTNSTARANATETAEPRTNATAQPSSNATAQPGAGAAPGQQPSAAERKAPIVRARAQLESSADAAASLALAEELVKEQDGADAAFLLAEDAAQKNNADAMIMTGRFYDPADGAPSGSIRKDAEQALLWYKKAQAAGHAQAASRIAGMKNWVASEAGKGNLDAQDLLKRF